MKHPQKLRSEYRVKKKIPKKVTVEWPLHFFLGKRVKTLCLQEPGKRADSVHPGRGETLLLLSPRHSETFTRAIRNGECGGSAVGARYIVRGREDATQTVLNIEGAQGCCPWSPPQEGARGQSSSARRGLPSKGEAHALHHQPDPALTLTTPCFLLSALSTRWRNA